MKIASLSPAVTEILFALGKASDIVCRDQFSDFPEEAQNIPKLMGHQKIDVELLASYKPELVFTSTIIQEKLSQQLKNNFGVVHQDPRTLNDIYESIRAIGTILSCEKEAGDLVLSMQQGLNEVKEKAKHLGKTLKVYCEEWHNPPMASGNWVPEIIRIAGGEPFPIPAGELSREVTLEEVSKFNPDLFIISWCGAGLLADKKIVQQRKEWQVLLVMKNEKNIRVIDDSFLNRPGPRLVEGARRLYGWLFEAIN